MSNVMHENSNNTNTQNALLKSFIRDLTLPDCIIQAGAANTVDILLTPENYISFLESRTQSDLYFLGGVAEEVQMRRAEDADIRKKNCFYIDLDIRTHEPQISDEEIMALGSSWLPGALADHPFLNQWRYIVFTGNGLHLWLVGTPIDVRSREYWKNGMKFILGETEKHTKMIPDKSCINVGRIARLPGSYNNKNNRHIQTAIVAYQDKEMDIALVEKFGEGMMLRRAKEEAQGRAQEMAPPILDGKDAYAAIQNLPITSLVCRLKEKDRWETDGRNFWEAGTTKKKACYVPEGENYLFHGGTDHFPFTQDGFSPFQLVRAEKKLSNSETFAWFKKEYPEIAALSEREAESATGVPVHPKEVSRTTTPSSALTVINPSLEGVLVKTRNLGMVNDYVVETVLATYISKELGASNPLWLLLVGAPSSNKTQLVSLLRKAPDTLALDVMTSNPFISGAKESENPQDLLPMLRGKCFIVKDYTSFFGRSEETVKQLLSDMVSIYDGEFSKHSSSRGRIEYRATFSHIGCVTSQGLKMRQKYMNMVGARFLTMRIPPLSDTQQEECFDIAWADDLSERFADASKAATNLVTSVCESIRNGKRLRPIAKHIQKKINLLAQLIAKARGVIQAQTNSFTNEHGEEVSHTEIADVQIEEPFRALHQLRRLCESLAFLRAKEEVSIEEVKTARLVALSSMPVNRAEILSLFQVQEKVTAKQSADILNQNHKTTKRHLDELERLGVLVREKDGYSACAQEDGPPNVAWVYSPHPRFKELLMMEGFPNLEA